MFLSRKKSGPLISASCDRPALRFFLLIGLFCLTFSAFWWNFDRRMEQINPEAKNTMIINDNQILTQENIALLESWQKKFSEKWNIPLLIQASKEELKVPSYAVDTLYVGAGALHAEGIIALPPLVRKVIGEGTRLTAEETLSACLKANNMGFCLNNTLQSLWTAFEQ